MAKSVWIKDIKDEHEVQSSFLVLDAEDRQYTSKEGEFLQLQLGDKTGSITAMIWEPALLKETPIKGNIISCKATIRNSKNFGPQLVVKEPTLMVEKEFDPADFLPSTAKNVTEMFAAILKTIDAIKNSHYKALLHAFFDDSVFSKNFKDAPASLLSNHNYIGGLLEHTTNVIRLCTTIARSYTCIDLDLLLTGAIISKVGHTESYKWETVIDRTDKGGLVGPMILSDRLLQEKLQTLPAFPQELKDKLGHMMITKYTRTLGNEQKPRFLEAAALAYADYLDANMGNFAQMYDDLPESDEHWVQHRKRGYYLYLG